MTNHEFDGLFDNEWEDRSELSWTEADWERYLAEQERAVRDYLKAYEKTSPSPDRIDRVAKKLGWDNRAPDAGIPASEQADDIDDSEGPWEPYTLHRNPVYVATKAILHALTHGWTRLASTEGAVPAPIAVEFLGALHRADEAAYNGIQALEMGDYTLALCFFKRGLRQINLLMATLSGKDAAQLPAIAEFRADAQSQLFDLREILLRVMNECRMEMESDDADI